MNDNTDSAKLEPGDRLYGDFLCWAMENNYFMRNETKTRVIFDSRQAAAFKAGYELAFKNLMKSPPTCSRGPHND